MKKQTRNTFIATVIAGGVLISATPAHAEIKPAPFGKTNGLKGSAKVTEPNRSSMPHLYRINGLRSL